MASAGPAFGSEEHLRSSGRSANQLRYVLTLLQLAVKVDRAAYGPTKTLLSLVNVLVVHISRAPTHDDVESLAW